MSAPRQYRLVSTENGILSNAISTFSRLDRAMARMDELVADPRSLRENDWLVLIDRYSHEHVHVIGRGVNKGKPVPVLARSGGEQGDNHE